MPCAGEWVSRLAGLVVRSAPGGHNIRDNVILYMHFCSQKSGGEKCTFSCALMSLELGLEPIRVNSAWMVTMFCSADLVCAVRVCGGSAVLLFGFHN